MGVFSVSPYIRAWGKPMGEDITKIRTHVVSAILTSIMFSLKGFKHKNH
jgi:hypothetical protein